MNYRYVYRCLIERAALRGAPAGYSESHHRVPRCLGGTDSARNLVRLTAREHFVAHLLLVKMHPGHHGLLHAAYRMSKSGKVGSREYEWLRAKHSAAAAESKRGNTYMLGKTHSPEARARISAAHKGKQHRLGHTSTPEHRQRIADAHRGKPLSEAHRAAIRAEMARRSLAKPPYSTGEARVLGIKETFSRGYRYFVVNKPGSAGHRYIGSFKTLAQAVEALDGAP